MTSVKSVASLCCLIFFASLALIYDVLFLENMAAQNGHLIIDARIGSWIFFLFSYVIYQVLFLILEDEALIKLGDKTFQAAKDIGTMICVLIGLLILITLFS